MNYRGLSKDLTLWCYENKLDNEWGKFTLSGCMSAIQRLRQQTLMFTVYINMARECHKSELKLNTDSNDHETQTAIIASFAAIDISNLGHGAFQDRKINWQRPVQNNSTWNKCFHLWKVPICPELISAQAGTEMNLVFISTPDRIRETSLFLQDFRIRSTAHIFSPLSAPPVTACSYTGLSGSTTRCGAMLLMWNTRAHPLADRKS